METPKQILEKLTQPYWVKLTWLKNTSFNTLKDLHEGMCEEIQIVLNYMFPRAKVLPQKQFDWYTSKIQEVKAVVKAIEDEIERRKILN